MPPRTSMSPVIWFPLRVYCSITTVSVPRVTTNAPRAVCPASGAATAARNTAGKTRMLIATLSSSESDGVRLRTSLYANRGDLVILADGVDRVHPLGDLSEYGVHAVQMSLRRVTDEELAAAGVLACVGHRQRSGDVFVHVAAGLALDRVPGATRPDSAFAGLGVGIAALNHEVGDHAMKLGAVIEARVGELLEVRHGVGGFVGEQLELDRAPVGFQNRSFVGHQISTAKFSSA